MLGTEDNEGGRVEMEYDAQGNLTVSRTKKASGQGPPALARWSDRARARHQGGEGGSRHSVSGLCLGRPWQPDHPHRPERQQAPDGDLCLINKVLGKWGATLAAIVVSIYLPGAGFWGAFGGFGSAVVSGFIAGGIGSGSFDGAVTALAALPGPA